MSAPMPAMSPTLSPTLSAMTPGLRGSSSGMPASTLPTRSAPTSAALVYTPPPTRANRAMELAPMAKPLMYLAVSGSVPKMPNQMPTPSRPRLATAMPITEPEK